jgi:FkbM family methyltransferase
VPAPIRPTTYPAVMPTVDPGKLARSALVRVPRLYDALAGGNRYLLMHRLGRVHEAEFRVLPDVVDGDSPLVLDVGGNVGQSVLSTLTVFPHARIHSFEPNPANHRALQRLARRFPGVTLEPFGLGADPGEHDLFIPVYNGRAMSGLVSFDEEAAAGWLTPETLYGFDPLRLEIRRTTASIKRLDDLALDPAVVKIDVQGLETAVIEGGMATIRRCRPVIIAETVRADDPAMALLAPLGYRRLELHDGRLIEARDERANQVLLAD